MYLSKGVCYIKQESVVFLIITVHSRLIGALAKVCLLEFVKQTVLYLSSFIKNWKVSETNFIISFSL